jgi:lactoylglutathione lyase
MKNTIIPIPKKNPEGINGKIKAGHLGLRTTDYEATIEWYIEKLGFRLLKKWTAGELNLAYLAPANDDNFWLEVIQDGNLDLNQDAPQSIFTGFQHFCLDVEDVDETLAALREKGVKVIREPFNVPPIGKRCGFITDLHGNMIEFAQNFA